MAQHKHDKPVCREPCVFHSHIVSGNQFISLTIIHVLIAQHEHEKLVCRESCGFTELKYAYPPTIISRRDGTSCLLKDHWNGGSLFNPITNDIRYFWWHCSCTNLCKSRTTRISSFFFIHVFTATISLGHMTEEKKQETRLLRCVLYTSYICSSRKHFYKHIFDM